MKIVEITPFGKSSIYGGLIKREAEIRKKGRGTFSRKGAARAGAATWSHKRFKGSVSLSRQPAELVRAKIRSANSHEEGGLLEAFRTPFADSSIVTSAIRSRPSRSIIIKRDRHGRACPGLTRQSIFFARRWMRGLTGSPPTLSAGARPAHDAERIGSIEQNSR